MQRLSGLPWPGDSDVLAGGRHLASDPACPVLRSFTSSILPVLFVVLGTRLLPVAAVETPGPRVDRRIPSWVVPVAADLSPDDDGATTRDETLLADHQERALADGHECFLRTVTRIRTSSGVEEHGEYRLSFEPAFETATIHRITIRRGDRVIDALASADLRLVHRENDLRARMFNGTVDAVYVLEDLRVDDILETAQTVRSRMPLLGGHFANSAGLGRPEGARHLQYRLLYPTARAIRFRVFGGGPEEPQRRPVGELTELIWSRGPVPAITYEDNTPAWHDDSPWVQLSDFSSWNEVARWAAALYVSGRSSGELQQVVDTIREEQATPAQRALAALRFVQDELRYLSVSVGRHGWQPHAPALALERRFGDCKDKSLLLVTMLRALGIEADAALVHSLAGKSLHRRLPSPFVFDHVVTRLRLGERELWVDPTRSHERGGWDALEPLPFRWALVIGANTTDLTSIPLPRPAEPELAVRETYRLGHRTTRAQLDVVTEHRGSEARAIRRQLETRSLAEVGQNALNFYAESNHEVSIREPMVASDDPQRDLVTTTETYEIGKFYEVGDRDLHAWAVRGELDEPFTRLRKAPLAVRFPRSVRHEIIVVVDEPYDIDDEHRTVSSPAFELEFWATYQHPRIHLRWDYHATSDQVAVEQIDEHLRAIETAQAVAYYGLRTGVSRRPDPQGFLVGLVFLVLLVGLIAGGGVLAAFVRRLRAGRRLRAFSARGRFSAGESPDTAVVLTGAEELPSAVRRLRCGCGGRFDLHEVTEAAYGDGRLTVAELRCLRCDAEEPRYFAIA